MLSKEFANLDRDLVEPSRWTTRETSPAVEVSFNDKGAQSPPNARRWDHHLSEEALARAESTLKASSSITNPGERIPLGSARPAAQYYPWESITIRGLNMKADQSANIRDSFALMSCSKGEAGFDLSAALNYSPSSGIPELLHFVKEHVELVHRPPYADWETSLTSGTTSALEMVFRMLCNRGDCILMEEFSYSGAMEAMRPLGLKLVSVEMDEHGLIAEALDARLQWDAAAGRKPTVLYTIPTGQNPTGTTQTRERREAIYRIAEHHDLIIVEDDPYYFLQLEKCVETDTKETSGTRQDRYLMALPPSYLSLDTSGRVIRLDSCSKILAPGLRIGWISACSELTAKLLFHTDFSTMSASGPSQVLLYKLLVETWGHHGLFKWLIHLSSQYSRRLHIVHTACKAHLPSAFCSWRVPTAGMFLWIRIDLSPLRANRTTRNGIATSNLELETQLYERARNHGVQISKGSWFASNVHSSSHVNFRLTFAAAPEESLTLAIEQLGKAIQLQFVQEPPNW